MLGVVGERSIIRGVQLCSMFCTGLKRVLMHRWLQMVTWRELGLLVLKLFDHNELS